MSDLIAAYTEIRKSRWSEPETLEQARRFDKYRSTYVRMGLCNSCASQATYGHQHSWYAIDVPCETCRPIVKGLPNPQGNSWKSL